MRSKFICNFVILQKSVVFVSIFHIVKGHGIFCLLNLLKKKKKTANFQMMLLLLFSFYVYAMILYLRTLPQFLPLTQINVRYL